MAKKTEGIKVNTEKKIVYIYSNVKQSKAEEKFIAIYAAAGYKLVDAKKEYSTSVKEMEYLVGKYAPDSVKTDYNNADYYTKMSIYSMFAKGYLNSVIKEFESEEKFLKNTFKYEGLAKVIAWAEAIRIANTKE